MNQIFTSGAITGLKWMQHFGWRDDLASVISDSTNDKWHVFNPSLHISDLDEYNMKDREGMNYDLFQLLRSDLVVVNFSYNSSSIGTTIELGAAYSHHIPIIGLNETGEQLHPWQREICVRIFDDYNKMVKYLIDHYINEK